MEVQVRTGAGDSSHEKPKAFLSLTQHYVDTMKGSQSSASSNTTFQRTHTWQMAADMIDLLSILPSASRAVSVRFVDQDLDTTTATTALFSTLLLHTTTQQSAISKSVLSLGLWALNMTTHGAGGIYQWIASTRCPRPNGSKPPARSYRPTGQTDGRTDGHRTVTQTLTTRSGLGQ